MKKVISCEYVSKQLWNIKMSLAMKNYGDVDKIIKRIEKACEPRVYSESQVYGMDCPNGACD